jgi:iron-sulfur cluster assembly accessory protein
MFTITEKAQKKIKEMQEEMGSKAFLRYQVISRCCNELQYDLTFDSHKSEQDVVVDFDGFRAVVHPADVRYIKNTEIDYVDGGFTIRNPNPLVSAF